MTKHLITLGGGGFSMEPSPNALDNYILKLTGKRKPRVCFVGTASGDSPWYVEKFKAAFPKKRATPSVLNLFQREADLARTILNQDVIYVGGGNTANLLAIWRLHGVDKLLMKAWSRGTVLCGISAGMNCWFDACSTDSFGPLAPLQDGLRVIPGAACPHFDGEAHRRPTLVKWVTSGKLPSTWAADDFAAFHFTVTGKRLALHRCIAGKKGAGCYIVRKHGRKAVVEPLPTELV